MRPSFAAVLALFLSVIAMLHAAEVPVAPAGWTAGGDITLAVDKAAEGGAALRLDRPQGRQDDASAVSASLAATTGVWELVGAIRSDLYAQDMSFNGSLSVDFLDGAQEVLASQSIVTVYGVSPWRVLRRRIEAPDGTTTVRVSAHISKTSGSLWLSGLGLERVGDLRVLRRDRLTVRFASARIGHLFYPEDPVAEQVTVTSPTPLAPEERVLRWEVRDYWGVRLIPGRDLPLVESSTGKDGVHAYTATIDLRGLPLQVGPWYGLHTEIALAGEPSRQDDASFAILPESRAARYDVAQIPFGSHTWDATIHDYFPLAARLGLRRCLSFWDWNTTAPYETGFGDSGDAYDRRIGLARQLGMRPYGMLYPIFKIERGDRSYSEEALRLGVRESIRRYGPQGLWGFQNGNEPPHWDPEMVAKDVESYRIIYQEAKKTDPDIFIIGTAVGPSETFFKAGFQDTQDAYNVHAYGDLSDLRQMMAHYKELFAKYGGAKPIYSTEIGSKSQGLSRHEIAMDLVRKAVCFFADGGEFFTWFAITYPDHNGNRRGGYGDSMDLYAGYLSMFLPRLDAIAHYHLVDTMLDKRFVQEKAYGGGVHAFLFANPAGECLQVLWSDRDSSDRQLPLPDVKEARVVRIDGHSEWLRTDGKGIAVRISEEPVLITYRAFDAKLPDTLDLPAELALVSTPDALPQGEAGEIVLRSASGEPELEAPPAWAVKRTASAPDANGVWRSAFSVTAPADTAAIQASFSARVRRADGMSRHLLAFRVPVVGRIQVEAVPLPAAEGAGLVEVRMRNNGATAASVDWKVEITGEAPMNGGTYDVRDADPSRARFTEAADGTLDLAPGQEVRRRLPMADVDRLGVYHVRASVIDDSGRETVHDRLMSGFLGVTKADKPLVIDGKLDEKTWFKARVLAIDEPRQYQKTEDIGEWTGAADLSGTLRFLWDDQFLYVGVEVTDDVFANPEKDGSLWAMDGIQFLFDPYRDRLVRKGRYDYAMGFGTKGDQAWCHLAGDSSMTTGPATDIRMVSAANRTSPGGRTYEVAIPWARLAPFTPKVGGDLGGAMILNEDDGKGRGGFMAWFSGVHLKEVEMVADLILAE